MNSITSRPRSPITTPPIEHHFLTEKISITSKIKSLLMNLQNGSNRRSQCEIDECTRLITDLLQKDSTLTELNLTRTCIHNDGAEAIINVLGINTNLTSLNLSNNYINTNGINALNNVLQINTTLTKLDLSRNYIGDQGAEVIGKALENNTTLKILCLRANQLNSNGINAIFEGLKNNKSLLSLDISYNEFNDDNAKTIAEVLSDNASLTNLNLNGMGIRSTNLKNLSNALKNNITLTNLHIAYETSLTNENEDSDSEGRIREDGSYVFHQDSGSDSEYEESRNTNRSIFYKEHEVIESICSRNRDKEILIGKAISVIRVLAPETPTEIANLISEQLLITETDAATLRRLGDLV
jgi:hypothetical protein